MNVGAKKNRRDRRFVESCWFRFASAKTCRYSTAVGLEWLK
jgi:hypothetical protein